MGVWNMPLPRPRKNEEKDDFIDRCMGNDTMNDEFPEADQRRAVCEKQWDNRHKKKSMAILPQVFGRVWAIVPDNMRRIIAEAKSKAPVSASDIEAYRQKEATRFNNIKGQIQILPLQGVLTPKASILSFLFGGTSLDYFTEAFNSAVNDKDVGAIVIDVDSPGGSVYGVQELTERIYNARNPNKPIVASISGLGASAAYWIASAADEIVITPSGETGSIGVMAVHEDVSERDKKEGIKYTMLTAGRYKAEGNEHEPLSEEDREALQATVDECYATMINDIARNRGVSAEKVKTKFGEGRVVTAGQAKESKMIDKVGTLDQVLRRLHPPTRKRLAAMQERINTIKAQV